MPINYDDIMKLKSEGQEFRYTERDTMLHEHWLHAEPDERKGAAFRL